MSGKSNRFVIVFCLIFGVAVSHVLANETPTKRSKRQVQLKITAKAWGPSQADVDAAKARVEASTALRSAVDGVSYRLISFEFMEREEKPGPSLPPDRFRIVFYDYTN